jgi:hypothetical protein
MRKGLSMWAGALVLGVGEAMAGAGGQPPGGGGGGGSGSEPEVLFLILFSLIPGIWLARKAMQARAAAEQA